MFGFLKKNDKAEKAAAVETGEVIGAPIKGTAVPSSEISDPTFREEMLGKGMAIRPAEGKVYAPADGRIEVMIESMHAVSMVSDGGAEILLHIGLDTVALKGKHFTGHVKEGDRVKKGDLLLEFDQKAIEAAGYDMISPVIICNSDDYRDITRYTGQEVQPGDPVMRLEK